MFPVFRAGFPAGAVQGLELKEVIGASPLQTLTAGHQAGMGLVWVPLVSFPCSSFFQTSSQDYCAPLGFLQHMGFGNVTKRKSEEILFLNWGPARARGNGRTRHVLLFSTAVLPCPNAALALTVFRSFIPPAMFPRPTDLSCQLGGNSLLGSPHTTSPQ